MQSWGEGKKLPGDWAAMERLGGNAAHTLLIVSLLGGGSWCPFPQLFIAEMEGEMDGLQHGLHGACRCGASGAFGSCDSLKIVLSAEQKGADPTIPSRCPMDRHDPPIPSPDHNPLDYAR